MTETSKDTTQSLVFPVHDKPHAPFVFFESAPAAGFTNGVINVTLAANRTWIDDGKAVNEQVVVAYLRGNIQAALSLRQAIDNALILASKQQSEVKS